MEEWRSIENFPNYMVSDMGRVKSISHVAATGRWKCERFFPETILVPNCCKDGYQRVTLSMDGKVYTRFVHRLVAKAFVANVENNPCVDHINTIKSDNRACNLRWVTYKGNSNNPLSRKHHKTSIKRVWENDAVRNKHKEGVRRWFSSEQTREKLRELRNRPEYIKNMRGHSSRNRAVVKMSPSGDILAEYYSASEAARETGVTATSLTAYCRGEIRPKNKIIWRYKDEVNDNK